MDDPMDLEIYFEFPEQQGLVQAGLDENLERIKEQSQKAMNIAMSSIRSMAYKVSRAIKQIEEEARPDEVEIEFGLKLEAEAGIEGNEIIPLVATGTAGAQFSVKFKWTLEKPSQAKVLISPGQ